MGRIVSFVFSGMLVGRVFVNGRGVMHGFGCSGAGGGVCPLVTARQAHQLHMLACHIKDASLQRA